jgi:D-3-phosphoglycerate dehydrogenase / 2-oxoglutarate reductase
MGKKVLITDKVHDLLVHGMEAMGFEVHYDTSIDMDILPGIIHEYDGIIINSKIKMMKPIIDKGTKLKFISRLGSGMEIIDVPYAKSKGIVPINSPEGNRNAVAEHAIGMLLSLANKLYKANAEVKNFIWKREENRGFELEGKTIGIIGLGNTGESLARKLSSWQLNILSFDKYRVDYGPDLSFVSRVNLEDILNEADIITLHLPLTQETKYLVDKNFLQKCRKKPVIINTSRGEVVKTEDLIFALKENLISGACLDVFENEKVETYTESEKRMYQQLFDFENVMVSPHIAGWTKESLEKIAMVTLEKIKRAMAGQ